MKENTTTANVIDDNDSIEDILDLDIAMPTVIWNPETTTLRFQNCDTFAQIRAIGMQFLCKVDENQVCRYCRRVNIEVEDGAQVVRFNISLNGMNYKKPKESAILFAVAYWHAIREYTYRRLIKDVPDDERKTDMQWVWKKLRDQKPTVKDNERWYEWFCDVGERTAFFTDFMGCCISICPDKRDVDAILRKVMFAQKAFRENNVQALEAVKALKKYYKGFEFLNPMYPYLEQRIQLPYAVIV
ncbi:MAG: hypothetical protein ACI4XD_05930 [Clostridia bacterium]